MTPLLTSDSESNVRVELDYYLPNLIIGSLHVSVAAWLQIWSQTAQPPEYFIINYFSNNVLFDKHLERSTASLNPRN